MLKNIEISNFKAIKDEPISKEKFDSLSENERLKENGKYYKKKPLILNNLTNVNYLVGPNGCGKSSVLEGVFQICNRDLSGGYGNDSNKRALNLETQYSDTETQFNEKTEFKFTYKDEEVKQDQKIKLHNFHYVDKKTESKFGNFNQIYLVWDFVGNEDLRQRIITSQSLLISDQNFRKSLLANYYNKIQSQLKDDCYQQFNKIAFRPTIMQPGKNVRLFSLKDLFYDNHQDNSFNSEKFDWLQKNYKTKIQKILPFLPDNEKLALSTNFNTKTPKISEKISLSDLSDGTLKLLSLFYLEECIIKGNFINGTSENLFILIEEPENGLHPELQKQIPIILNQLNENISEKGTKAHNLSPNLRKYEKYPTQFLISTHSPFIIREALETDNQNIYHIENGQTKNINMLNKEKIRNEGVLSFDRAIASLGFEMRDIYYPNCLIYVEGPVDKIYIEYWLQKYIETTAETKELKRNFDYEFVEYGGSLASHLVFDSSFKNPKSTDENFRHSLFNVFSLNRKIFFITDNDKTKDKKGNPKRAFDQTKNRIEKVFKDLDNCVFYKESNLKIDTIEKYLTEDVKESKAKNKLNAALLNIKYWHKNKIGLEAFAPEAKNMVEKIYNFIIQK
jgi:predicted ATP-dependent endonuclease of OLD family